MATPPTPKAAKKAAEEAATTQSCLSQAIAVLGIPLVAMGEEVGSQMSLRLYGHLVHIWDIFPYLDSVFSTAMASPSSAALSHWPWPC
jgi:hypothetical protein